MLFYFLSHFLFDGFIGKLNAKHDIIKDIKHRGGSFDDKESVKSGYSSGINISGSF